MRCFEVAVAVVVLGLLAVAKPSMQLSIKHPLHHVIRRINQEGPYLGLILESDNNEKALNESNLFVPRSSSPNLSLSGRTFRVGQIKGVDVICVKTGGGAIATASTAQLLVDNFEIEGIVHFGTVGAVNDSLFIGDVVVPQQVAYIGNWQWKKFKSKGVLAFGEYNYPEAGNYGNNTLGAIDFQPTKVFNSTGKSKTIFWLPINSSWSRIANNLQNVELQQCISTNKCLPDEPEIVYGLRAASADIYVQNAAIRKFINTQFKVAVVDEGTAIVVWVALTNNIPVVVFRGVSNTAGGSTSYKSYSYLGSQNALSSAVTFIAAVGNSAKSGTSAAH